MPEFSRSISGRNAFTPFTLTVLSADGAVPISTERIAFYALNHGGAALALTIARPTPADDGKILIFTGEDIAAHVITQAADGFNHKGAAGTATWSGATQGDSLMIIAHALSWWTLSKNVVVVA
jgi:hypothetical protein